MNIYYTAKDIEDLAARGVQQLELGPHTSLTDFARETAEQLDVRIITRSDDIKAAASPAPVAESAPPVEIKSAYNKPRACQGEPAVLIQPQEGSSEPAPATVNQAQATPVTRLVDMMGRIIKRGD